ncbi:MAG TPA: class I SAM-dependent methyltransferase [Rubrobacteraceae bacterium]|nr:class I SAM-dependent methyltransferase [Rubrobacteraceae bacterium]
MAHAPEPVGEPSTLLERLHRLAGRTAVLVGLDLAIGVPATYAQRAGLESFVEWLPKLGSGEWAEFYRVCERPDQISVHRPFYPQRPGGTAMKHLLHGLQVDSANDLLRSCDRGHPGRPAAASIFWTMGAKQVGKAAISGWRDLLAPAYRSLGPDVALWPFDGELHELLRSRSVTVVETYPAEFYRQLSIELGSKRNQEDRRSNASVLLKWAETLETEPTPEMRAALQDGFGSRPDGEDSFDATVGLFGMLNVVLGFRPPGEPSDPAVRKIEGWMLGQPPEQTTRITPATKPQTSERPVPSVAKPPAEYDPLADLYDLEYTHDHDLPFWLALAEREGGPIVEWGAGTGRLAVPLAEAGFHVTAVELSERMIQRGREKNASVEWTPGDARTAKLGRAYNLAVCAFNSFLCLRTVDDALAALRNVREHLIPGGLLGIEVSAFSPEELSEEPGAPTLRHDLTRSLPHGELKRFSVSRYDAATQLLSMSLFYELYGASGELKTKRTHDLTIRVTGRDELNLMLRLCGFETETVHGGFEGEPFTSESGHLLVLARSTR